MPDLYESDFYAWIQQQAKAVRIGAWDEIDCDHLAEEIEVIVDVWSNLAANVERILPKAYVQGREVAAEETGLPLETFPEALSSAKIGSADISA